MKVLITGGAGFIGSHLAVRLIARGDEIEILDDLSTGDIRNLGPILSHERCNVTVDTVCNRSLTEERVRWADQVYHLAAPVGVKYIMEHPVRTILDNLRAVDVLFEMTNRFRTKVLLTSTSEVYGKNLDYLGADALGEEDYQIQGSTRNHRWAYAATKSVDEFLGFAYSREFGMPVVIVRLFNTVGPGQSGRYGMVVPTFVRQALDGGPITIYGSGEQTRSFLHVFDAIDAMVDLMDSPEAVGDVFNIGHGQPTTIRQLAEAVQERTGSRVELQFIDYETAYGSGFEDMQRRIPDISKINRTIGWSPKRNLQDILDDVIAATRGDSGERPG